MCVCVREKEKVSFISTLFFSSSKHSVAAETQTKRRKFNMEDIQ